MPEQLAGEAEACQQLSIGRTSLYGLIRTGELESVKIGRRRLILVSSIDRYITRLRKEQPLAEGGKRRGSRSDATPLDDADLALLALGELRVKVREVGLNLPDLDVSDVPSGAVLVPEDLADHAPRGWTIAVAAPVDDPAVLFAVHAPTAHSARLVLAYLRARGWSASTRPTRAPQEVGAA